MLSLKTKDVCSLTSKRMLILQLRVHKLLNQCYTFLNHSRVTGRMVHTLLLKGPSHTQSMTSGGWSGSMSAGVLSCSASPRNMERLGYWRM